MNRKTKKSKQKKHVRLTKARQNLLVTPNLNLTESKINCLIKKVDKMNDLNKKENKLPNKFSKIKIHMSLFIFDNFIFLYLPLLIEYFL